MFVHYVANKSSSDGTTRVDVGGKSLTLGGAPVDLTEDDLALLSGRFVLEPVEKEEEDVADSSSVPVVDMDPAPPAAPAQFGAAPQSPATPGASVSTPNTSTPPSGS